MNWSDPIVVANLGLALTTFALVIVTLVYTMATRKMANTMWTDYVARNTPLLDLKHEFTPLDGGKPFTYHATIMLINKGAVAIRVNEILIRIGETDLSKQGGVILGIDECRTIGIKFTLHDFGWETLQRGEAEFVAEVRYIGFEGRLLTQRFPLPRPWGERR